jgi:hypothetical protein
MIELKPSDLKPTEDQKWKIITIGIMAVAIVILWNVKYLKKVLYPFKLITVAFHELGHAVAGKLTGAKIVSIELDPELGGKTVMKGGVGCVTLPAGYLGSSIIGSAIVFCSFNTLATRIMAGVIVFMLILTIYWAKNMLARGISVLFIGLLVAAYFLFDGIALNYFVLFLGVMSSLYSVWDILEDLVFRKVNESDASVFAKKYKCLPAQVWGFLWFLISLSFLIGSILLAIIVFKNKP